MKFVVSGIFWDVLLIVGGGELTSNKGPLLRTHGCQLLPLATSHLVVNNKEFDVEDIFWGVLLIASRAHFQNIKDSSLITISLIQDRVTILHMCHQSEILHSLIFNFIGLYDWPSCVAKKKMSFNGRFLELNQIFEKVWFSHMKFKVPKARQSTQIPVMDIFKSWSA